MTFKQFIWLIPAWICFLILKLMKQEKEIIKCDNSYTESSNNIKYQIILGNE